MSDHNSTPRCFPSRKQGAITNAAYIVNPRYCDYEGASSEEDWMPTRLAEYCCGIICAFSYLSSDQGKWWILDWAREGGSEALVLGKKAVCWTLMLGVVLVHLWMVSGWWRYTQLTSTTWVRDLPSLVSWPCSTRDPFFEPVTCYPARPPRRRFCVRWPSTQGRCSSR